MVIDTEPVAGGANVRDGLASVPGLDRPESDAIIATVTAQPIEPSRAVLVPAELAGRVQAIAASAPDVRAVYLFGSMARGEATADSDIDIAVLFDHTAGLARLDELQDGFERALGRGVDLVDLASCDPSLAIDAIDGERLFCHDDEVDEFELYLLRRGGDLAPFERERRELHLRPSGQVAVSPGAIRAQIVVAKLDVIARMRAGIASLPLASREDFLADPRSPAAAESDLRRLLEALLDVGRHVLAKGFGVAAVEYAAIADRLMEMGLLQAETAELLRRMGRYRNRMVHFYDEVGAEELYDLLAHRLADVELVIEALRRWMAEHPDRVDRRL